MSSATIRPLAEENWQTLRDLRLLALEDSPDSFGPTLASAVEQPESYWRAWARGRRSGLQVWAAFARDSPVGLVSGGVRDPGTGHFGALWVAPSARGTG